MMQTRARHAAIAALKQHWTHEALAATIVDALAVAGEQDEWDSETVEQVVNVLNSVGLPDPTADHNTPYWRTVTGNEED